MAGNPVPRRRLARAAVGASVLAASIAIAGGTFLSLYDRERGAPTGYDTPWYTWRAKVVAEGGLPALRAVPEAAKPVPARPGYPILAGFLDSTVAVDPPMLALAMPALGATVVALGAGAFARRALREPEWGHVLLGVMVGASVNVTLTAVGHVDTLVVQGLAMAAAVTALTAAEGEKGGTATALLVGGAALVHWAFMAVVLALLAAAALAVLAQSRGPGREVSSTPAGRLGVVAGAAAVAAAATLALTGFDVAGPSVPAGLFAARLAQEAPRYAFPIIGSLAVAGALLFVTARAPERRRALTVAILWAASSAAAVVTMMFVELPAHRILAFALGIPLLAGAAVAAAARWLGGLRFAALAGIAASLVLLGAIVGTVAKARDVWRPVNPRRAVQYEQVRAAAAYIETVGSSKPVVYVIDPAVWRANPRIRPQFDVIRAGVPVDQYPRTHVYLGGASALLAGDPTFRSGDPAFNEASRTQWEEVRGILLEDPIVLSLEGFVRPAGRDPRGVVVAPGVQLLRGPSPKGPLPRDPPPPSVWSVGAAAGRALLLLAAVGSGWVTGLVRAGWTVRASLAPALGVAVVVVSGVVAGRIGVDGSSARPWVAAVAAGVGWTVAWGVRRRSSRSGIC
jgi:hypothetical protein